MLIAARENNPCDVFLFSGKSLEVILIIKGMADFMPNLPMNKTTMAIREFEFSPKQLFDFHLFSGSNFYF